MTKTTLWTRHAWKHQTKQKPDYSLNFLDNAKRKVLQQTNESLDIRGSIIKEPQQLTLSKPSRSLVFKIFLFSVIVVFNQLRERRKILNFNMRQQAETINH